MPAPALPINPGPSYPSEDSSADPNRNDVVIDAAIYESGSYKVGTDIPAGIYMATNDGSSASRITVKDSPEPNPEKPNIIITARYLSDRRAFADRAAYVESVRRGGGVPVMPNDDAELSRLLREGYTEYADLLAGRYDGLVLTGGGDVAAHFFNQEHHPASNPPDEILDVAELALTRAFIQAGKPVLGICRGMQVLNIAMGGELIQDIPALLDINVRIHNDSRARHTLNVRAGTWLYDMFGSQIETNSTHHQCVDGVAAGFTVVARFGPVIEAMERGNTLGVQFHPERMLGEGMAALFEDFIERCSYEGFEVHIFSGHMIVEIEEGQYIDVEGARLQNIENTSGMFDAVFETQGHYPEGMYWVGRHLPEGDYRLAVTDNAGFSSYAVYEGAAQESLLYSSAIPGYGKEITLKNGQFIKLIYATMTPD